MSAPQATTGPSLLPREKGAWGQVLFPLTSGLILARASAPSVAFAAAALAAFFAHEPVLVLLGGRGERTRRSALRRALGWVASCAVGGAAAFAYGFAASPESARSWVVAPVLLSLASLGTLAAGRERTTGGEILAATAMASWIVPMGTSSAAPLHQTLWAWVAYVIAFGVATVAVRGVLEANKNQGRSRLRLVARIVAPLALFGTVAAWLGGLWPAGIPLALAPTIVLAFVLSVRELHPRRLRSVGWSLIASSAFLAVVLAVTLGGPQAR